MSFRIATMNDTNLLYQWRLDAEAANPQPGRIAPTFKQHTDWLAARIANDLVDLLIWTQGRGGKQVGTVRVESNGEISFYSTTDPTEMLTAALAYTPIHGGRLKAAVDLDDIATREALENVGFKRFAAHNLVYRP